MNKKLEVIKAIVGVASIGLTVISGIISKKEFDLKVTEKVSEALAKANKEA